jgi:hypothetical protein
MSSNIVRQAVNQAIADAAAPWPTFDLSDFVTMDEALSEVDSNAVLIQYTAAGDNMVTIGGEGNQGYEETGSIVLHVVVPSGFDSSPVIDRCDAIRLAVRGRRLADDVTVEQFDPFTDFGVGLGLYPGAWHGYAANLFVTYRDCG